MEDFQIDKELAQAAIEISELQIDVASMIKENRDRDPEDFGVEELEACCAKILALGKSNERLIGAIMAKARSDAHHHHQDPSVAHPE